MTSPVGGGERRTFTPDFLTELFRNPLDPGYADAAARRAREGPRSAPRRRLISTVSALTLIGVGFLLVVAYQQTVADEPGRTKARATLAEQVRHRRDGTVTLQNRADELRAEVATLQERELGGAAVARLRDLEAQTGLAPVHGPGAKITIGDGPTAVNPVTGKQSSDARVRDSDLQLAANALWAAGAEAIAINGQRLTATSTIRQAGEAILVDFRPVASPYEVVAIGPDSLAGDFRDGYAGRFFRELVARYGMSFDATTVHDVTLDAATELKLRVAVPSTPPPSGGPPSPGPDSPPPAGTPTKGGR
ncbi:uncharacterized protein YlxW (UPF0749 family) [Krasilnikovia cinnamomea]|uniref:Uncharacterized protein YlxW (UPF0749 family) n=1 Tax=Krasilnikovia cinnamomea TaxID=349313 RepID=A0A4Q7ZEM5_9ACTN|nr:DUF881 domain-containing protein [Krasilnikovia cinnamomea]RZU48409.1 uncharacterized protein YlxW (UPF0749 family) [Krasilnikovia cinnamomea]